MHNKRKNSKWRGEKKEKYWTEKTGPPNKNPKPRKTHPNAASMQYQHMNVASVQEPQEETGRANSSLQMGDMCICHQRHVGEPMEGRCLHLSWVITQWLARKLPHTGTWECYAERRHNDVIIDVTRTAWGTWCRCVKRHPPQPPGHWECKRRRGGPTEHIAAPATQKDHSTNQTFNKSQRHTALTRWQVGIGQ